MRSYLYCITNLINNKAYIGVHRTNNPSDNYMGSGTAIRRAIKKYGINNFRKEILQEFDSYADALDHEKEIVNTKFVQSKDTYNLKEGGTGGFDHINNLPKEARKNIQVLRAKIASGELIVGGSAHWSPQGKAKIIRQARKNAPIANELSRMPKAIEKRKKTYKQNNHSKGNKNSQYGTVWCVKEDVQDLYERKKFRANEIPAGWISTTEWRELRKNKNRAAYGKKWYNNGSESFLLLIDDPRISELGLVKGRIMNMMV